MKLYKFHIPARYVAKIDSLVRSGEYPNRSDFVTKAIKEKLEEEKEKEKKGRIKGTTFHSFAISPFYEDLVEEKVKEGVCPGCGSDLKREKQTSFHEVFKCLECGFRYINDPSSNPIETEEYE